MFTSSGLQPYGFVSNSWSTQFTVNGVTVPENGTVAFFSGVHNDGNTGLWMTLGASDNTKQIDVENGQDNLYPYNLTIFNNKLYFTGYDNNGADGGRGLFVYDPMATPNKATQVFSSSAASVEPTNPINAWGSLSPITMAAFNNDLYFNASSSQTNGVPGLFRANLDSQGNANPTQVVSLGATNGPWSLTPTD
ncbi:MAG TPA: hypothetical protein VLZ05_04595 [Mycobacterium sp.]|nr:hypothetical protein [Mycobacterium sp.]HUH68208.1 hypothetical protein [Mycobacterium sp.]